MTTSRETPTSAQVLLCRSAGRLCAFPLVHMLETMRALPVDPVPDMPPFVLGVAVIRGAVSPVLDLAFLLGRAAGVPARRFVTLKLDGRSLALALDDVIGVRSIAAAELATVAPLLQDTDTGMVRAITILDAQLTLVLQASRLMPESQWQALAATEGSA